MIEKKKKDFFFFFFFFDAIKFTESAAFCRVGRVTGSNNKFLLGPVRLGGGGGHDGPPLRSRPLIAQSPRKFAQW